MQRIVITGIKGRIGTILANKLSPIYDVFGIDRIKSNDTKYFHVDISHFLSLNNVFQTISAIDSIIHLAACPDVKGDWRTILRDNVVGTRNVYECARLHHVKRVIYASSNHVTGAYEGFPPSLHTKSNPVLITVRDAVRPDSDYGTSKVFGEAIARQYYELYGIASICLRIGSLIATDDPTQNNRSMKTWLSHRDLVQLVEKSLRSSIDFGIYYGVSDNKGRFWDISNAQEELGYIPQDDASRRAR